jgi:acyl-homoserine lactone acylase PvdQ
MTSFPENYRGIHAVSLLKQADSLSLDKLIDLAYDPFLPGAEALMSGLKQAYKNETIPNIEIKEAIELINNWDYKVHANSVAMTLTQYYFNHYYRSGLIKKNRRNIITIINYMSQESSIQERRDIFEKAVNQLIDDFGTWKVEWGEYNRYQRINGDIVQKFNDSLKSVPIGMASGYWGALASFGTRKGENTKRIYGVGGNSFVGVVEFGKKVKAKTLLAGGQSGDPNSPHFDDQVLPYANATFKTVAYYKDDVIKRAISKYRPGEDKQAE